MAAEPERPGSGEEGGGRRPAPTEAQVRSELIRFAELIQRLERDDRLLRSLPFLMGRLGDIRRMLFDFEVRVTERLLPIEDPTERESRRIVREARESEREGPEEWGGGWHPPERAGDGEGGGDGEGRGDGGGGDAPA